MVVQGLGRELCFCPAGSILLWQLSILEVVLEHSTENKHAEGAFPHFWGHGHPGEASLK